MFQYVKVNSVLVEFSPDVIEGTHPPSGYIIMVGNENINVIDYAKIPTLPGARYISNVRKTKYRFTRPGRNDDFGKWQNTTEIEQTYLDSSNFSFRIRFLDNPRTTPMVIRLCFYLTFSKRIDRNRSNKLGQVFDVIDSKKFTDLDEKDEEKAKNDENYLVKTLVNESQNIE
jgi:hypothetical protein